MDGSVVSFCPSFSSTSCLCPQVLPHFNPIGDVSNHKMCGACRAAYKHNACPFCKEDFVKDEMKTFITEYVTNLSQSVERVNGNIDADDSNEMEVFDLFEYWQVYEYQYLHSPTAMRRVAVTLLNDATFFSVLTAIKKQGSRKSTAAAGSYGFSSIKSLLFAAAAPTTSTTTASVCETEHEWFLHDGLCGVLFRLHNLVSSPGVVDTSTPTSTSQCPSSTTATEVIGKHFKLLDDIVEKIIAQYEVAYRRRNRRRTPRCTRRAPVRGSPTSTANDANGANGDLCESDASALSTSPIVDTRPLGCLYTQALTAWLLEHKSRQATLATSNGIGAMINEAAEVDGSPAAEKVRRVARAVINAFTMTMMNTSGQEDESFLKARVREAVHPEYLEESCAPIWGGRHADEFAAFFCDR